MLDVVHDVWLFDTIALSGGTHFLQQSSTYAAMGNTRVMKSQFRLRKMPGLVVKLSDSLKPSSPLKGNSRCHRKGLVMHIAYRRLEQIPLLMQHIFPIKRAGCQASASSS